jgi:cullin-associated NEDD8-dissociated protein 1
VGNLAVGSPTDCLPQLVGYIQAGNGDDRKRTLALGAVKEFIVHASVASLAPSADELWEPLIAICAIEGPPPAEAKPAGLAPDEVKARDKRVDAAWKASESVREQWKATEVSRTMAAECLGKITLADPQRYLAKLQVRAAVHRLARLS